MTYLLVTIVLFIGILIYLRIADKFNIIDRPNERSSHDYITIRGGGVVFWLAAMMLWLINIQYLKDMEYFTESLTFLIGITLISAVSFIDDIKSLPNRIRIAIHFLSVSCIFYGLGIFTVLPVWLILVAFILFVGILNAYNFMDGINGMTGLYSLSILIAMKFTNQTCQNFTAPDFINYAIIACVVFLFFNFRKRAKCFAGDVGSMAIAFWIVTILLQLMLKTNSIIWIMFLSVYGVDTVCTIFHRIYLKQNIFKAHRMHIYQILTNEKHLSHQLVSFLYAAIQLLISSAVIAVHFHFSHLEISAAITIIIILSLVYLLKFKKA